MPIHSWESPRKTTRAGEDSGVTWGHHHSRCVLSNRGRMRPRQAKDVRVQSAEKQVDTGVLGWREVKEATH